MAKRIYNEKETAIRGLSLESWVCFYFVIGCLISLSCDCQRLFKAKGDSWKSRGWRLRLRLSFSSSFWFQWLMHLWKLIGKSYSHWKWKKKARDPGYVSVLLLRPGSPKKRNEINQSHQGKKLLSWDLWILVFLLLKVNRTKSQRRKRIQKKVKDKIHEAEVVIC